MGLDSYLCENCWLTLGACSCGEDNAPYSDGDDVVCPYCLKTNYACDSDGYLYEESTTEYDCGHCGETFDVDVSVKFSWTTKRRKEDSEKAE